MNVIKKAALLVGVALCVTPIFSLVHAQSGNDGTRTYFELQALRAEVAELRDMIERQQYELRRLKQAQQPRPSVAPPAQTTAGSFSNAGVSAGSVTGVASAANTNGVVVPNSYPGNPVQTQGTPNTVPTSTNTVPTSAQAPLGTNDQVSSVGEGFYLPYDQPDTQSVASAAQSAQQQTGVEERVITAPPLQQPSPASGYPPVIDRSVGGTPPATNQASTNLPQTTPNYQTTPTTVQQQRTLTYPPANTVNPATSQGYNTGAPSTVVPSTSVPSTSVPSTSVPSTVVSVPSATGTAQYSTGNAQGATQYNSSAPAANTVGQVANAQPQISTQTQSVNTQPVVTLPQQQVATAAPAPRVLAEREYYSQGFNLVKQSQFKEAIQVFKQLIAQHPSGNLVGDAHYWIGESSFLARDLETSKTYFRAFMDNYQNSARIPGAMLRTAYIEQEQGNQMEARILLNEIIQFHPSSDAVHAAKNRLADLESQN